MRPECVANIARPTIVKFTLGVSNDPPCCPPAPLPLPLFLLCSLSCGLRAGQPGATGIRCRQFHVRVHCALNGLLKQLACLSVGPVAQALVIALFSFLPGGLWAISGDLDLAQPMSNQRSVNGRLASYTANRFVLVSPGPCHCSQSCLVPPGWGLGNHQRPEFGVYNVRPTFVNSSFYPRSLRCRWAS